MQIKMCLNLRLRFLIKKKLICIPIGSYVKPTQYPVMSYKMDLQST